MVLGKILGGEAWRKLNDVARDKRRAAEERRKKDFEAKKRRETLNAAGFIPLKSYRPHRYESWGAE